MAHHRPLLLALMAGLAPAAALAQPALVITGMNPSDLSFDGSTFVGSLYEADSQAYYLYSWSPATGPVRLPARFTDGSIHCSADAGVISYGDYNVENLNNSAGTITYNPAPGYPHPDNTSIAHYWSPATGPVNMGPAPNGNICDYNINTAYGVSANGRYVVVSGWSASTCGPYRAWRYDTQAASWSQLPFSTSPPPTSAASRGTRANSASADGAVICGWDNNYDSTNSFQLRRACAWTFDGSAWSQTILDPDGGEAIAVSGDGSTIVGKDHTGAGVRWVFDNGAWGARSLGAASQGVFVTYDGSTILGADYIWNANLNGGVGMNIGDYLASIGAVFPDFTPGSPVGSIWGISADGSVLGIRGTDARNACLTTFPAALVYLNGSPCVQPYISFNPVSQPYSGGPNTFGFVLNTFVGGTWPLNYQWQKETSPGVWTNLSDDVCGTTNALNYSFQGSTTPQLRVGFLTNSWAGNYRCVVHGPCNTVISTAAYIGVPPVSCYPNCDGSTISPILNVNDFICFQTHFAAGDSYANCDHSTTPPVLNVNDFICFQTQFAAGCR